MGTKALVSLNASSHMDSHFNLFGPNSNERAIYS